MSELTLDLQLVKPGFCLSAGQAIPLQGITVIWGQSGSGKSLLLRSIAGFEKPAGLIQLDSTTLLHSDSATFVQPYQRPIAYVAQQPELFTHLSVRQNLNFGYRRRGREADRTYTYDEVVAALGLTDLLDKKPATLSGGQKQRCAIAQSLLSYPKLLLMDEPLSALDDQARQSIMSYLAKIPRLFNVPIIYVTHAYEELLKLADQVVVINQGRASDCYPLDEYCSNYANQALPAEQLCSVLSGKLTGAQEFGLSRLNCDGQNLYIPQQPATTQPVKIIVYAKDVSISLSRSADSSILNLLETRIERIIDYSNSSKLLQLKLAEQQLLSLITEKSLAALKLQEGQPVIAQIKTVSLKA